MAERNALDVNAIMVDPSDFPEQLKQYYARLFPYAKYGAGARGPPPSPAKGRRRLLPVWSADTSNGCRPAA